MALFGKKSQERGPRTPEERERARAEREARRRGLPLAPELPAELGPGSEAGEPAPEPAAPEPAPPEPAEPAEPARRHRPAPLTPATEPPVVPDSDREPHAEPAPLPGPPPMPGEAPVSPPPTPPSRPSGAAGGAAAAPVVRPDPALHPASGPATQTLPRAAPAPQLDEPGAYLDEPPDEDWAGLEAPTAGPRRVSAGSVLRRRGRATPEGSQAGGRRKPPPLPPLPGDPGPPGPRGSRAMRAAGVLVILVAIALLYLVNATFQPFKGNGGQLVGVTVPRGANAGDIGTLLATRHVIDSKFFFDLRARLAGDRASLKPGHYVLRRDSSYGDVLATLEKGPPPPKVTKITITEGRSRYEASQLLKKTSLTGNYYDLTRSSPLLDPRRYGAPRGTHSLEGFLFPATYDVLEGGTVQSLIDKQLRAFKSVFARVDLRGARRRHLTPYDVLIIASMVEREAALDRERPLIAAVMYNRLRQGIPLHIDATIRYADHNWTRPLRQSELNRPGPYNTALHKGLPPTPIGSPGLKSIEAAAHPAHVPYLYYVVKNFGCLSHAFSSTDAQFQRDAQHYLRQQQSRKPLKHCPK